MTNATPRVFESEKGVTTDNDIFHFSVKATILKLLVEVTDLEGKMIPGFSLKLFEDIKENNLREPHRICHISIGKRVC